MDPVVEVLLWWIAFAGSHTVLTHPPIRSALVARLGATPFQGLFSLVAFATFVPLVWVYFAARDGATVPLSAVMAVPGSSWVAVPLVAVALLTIVLGVAAPNPFLLIPQGRPAARGMLRVTRHPLFMGVALWAFAHLLVNPAPIDVAFFGGALAYSLLGSAHQDWRKRLEADAALRGFYEETSWVPFAAILAGRNRLVLGELHPVAAGVALAIFAVVFAFHHRFFGTA